jgi:tetratricopeptide (TPR) repeat protein
VISENKQKVLELFTEGRKLYKLMEFEEALKFFARAVKLDPDDGPSKVYFARCKEYIKNPPPEDWDGVWIMTKK